MTETPHQTCTAQPSRMSHFGELRYLTKNLRKCQKSPFLSAKCTNLVTLAGTRFHQCYQMTALPDMNIFCQILMIFCFFLNFWQTTSGSSPKCDILEGWQKHVWAQICCPSHTVTLDNFFEPKSYRMGYYHSS